MAKKENKGSERESQGRAPSGGLAGILGGLVELVEKLGELAEKGEKLSRSGSVQFEQGAQKRDLRAVYGFSVRTGIGGDKVKVEPFGNVRRDRSTGESVVHEIHEPITDLFEEEDHVLIVAEMPGIDAVDINLELHGDVLTLSAEGEERKYRKEILLPGEFGEESLSVTSRNGIVKIVCRK